RWFDGGNESNLAGYNVAAFEGFGSLFDGGAGMAGIP
ncbi:MAG: hypothetical protein JWR16_2693, partial [Nevskia sp.]|nr:hypothetical protein [Nevskia sp.]